MDLRTDFRVVFSAVLMLAAAAFAAPSPRQTNLADFDWRFHLGEVAGAEAQDFRAGDWKVVDLPHDWSIAGPFSQANPSGGAGGYLPGGIGWYQKSFRFPPTLAGKKISIQFDGVYEKSRVWVNGQLLGERPYGFISFSYDLTPHLKFGDAENVIAVRVDNSRQPNCRWYSGSGIDRNVWITITDPVHVAHWGTYVTTPKAAADAATVQVHTQVANESTAAANCTLVTTILDASGAEMAKVESPLDVTPGGEFGVDQSLPVAQPRLWACDTPYLYTVHSSLRRQGEIIDEYDTPLGIRQTAWDVDKGFLLNGKPVKLNGVCVHQDGGSVGSAVPTAVWRRRLAELKEMGCNAIRTSHNPPSPEFLDLCDQMGLLVMDEAFDEWVSGKGQVRFGYHTLFNDWWQRDAGDMIRRDRNHPSIVIWSAGNEVPDQLSPRGPEILKGLVDLFHQLDPTRPVTVACDHAYSEPASASPEFMALQDVAGYNYVDRWGDRKEKYFSIDRQAFPTRKFIGTEDGAMGGTRGDYSSLFPPATQPAAAGGRGRVGFGRGFAASRMIDVEQLWKNVGTYDYVTGDFMWTGIDYIGESFWPSKSATSGVLDTCGFKKDGFYFYQSQWTSAPMVHLFPHWNLQGHEGQFIPVRCFTNCDTVELFLNGKSIGVKGDLFPRTGMAGRYGNSPPRARVMRTTADLHLEWDVPYEPGELKAVGTRDGRIVATDIVQTAGEPAAVGVVADRAAIASDRRDVAQITVKIFDQQGRLAPMADNPVQFAVTGPGRIIGVDNGNPVSHEDYQADRRNAFNGLALVILQSTGGAGTVHLTASSAGLKSGEVDIAAQP